MIYNIVINNYRVLEGIVVMAWEENAAARGTTLALSANAFHGNMHDH
jgi:hypothetical protein